jgi:hypothetical protein
VDPVIPPDGPSGPGPSGPGPGPSGPLGPAYPATLDIERADHVANWRPLVHWLLVIPHEIVLYVLGIVSGVVAIVSWFIILFTGKLPEGLIGLQCLYIRYSNRVAAYAFFMREEYPPFTFETVAPDPGDDPGVRTDLAPETEGRNRLTTAFRFILVIPHYIVLAVLGIALLFVLIAAFFVVLFTGNWPEGLRRFAVGYLRWSTRVATYHLLLVDDYPPFSLE